jgi:hypothetical protein
MANHVLSLEVPTVMNTCILKIMDTSVYSDLIPVVCPTLNVTVPGFAYSVQLEGTQMTEFVASGHITQLLVILICKQLTVEHNMLISRWYLCYKV